MTVGDFLTEKQIKAATVIWRKDRAHFHQRVLAEIVEPNMAEINRRTGQENHAGYIAYAIEYAISETERRK